MNLATRSAKLPVGVLLLALILFVPLFLTRGLGAFDFWWWMTANILLLLAVVQYVDDRWRQALVADLQDRPLRKAALGILSALALYVVFWLGNQATRYLFARAGGDISGVYAFKEQASVLRIALLMTFIIGPGEELFWRGFLQRRFEAAAGGLPGWLLATAVYTVVHVASGNPILVLAAAVCGLFWGWLYLRYRSMLLNAVSHTVWDLTVFLLFPFA
jgi:uncharacterized protein